MDDIKISIDNLPPSDSERKYVKVDYWQEIDTEKKRAEVISLISIVKNHNRTI